MKKVKRKRPSVRSRRKKSGGAPKRKASAAKRKIQSSSKVAGKVTHTGNYVYAQCFVRVDGHVVDLTNRTQDVKSGRYELEWAFAADPGATFSCTATTVDGKTATVNKQTVPLGRGRIDSGPNKLPDYQPVMFTVPSGAAR